jgi:4-hydroxyphenylpyruvate dioxygenase
LKAIWETDFEALAANDTGEISAGLVRIDHVAQTMESEELLTWTLFYTSIFDMTKTPIVDFDPNGMVYSRAIQSSDGGVRLILNGAETHRSFAGRFVADSSGPSVQHLAFASDDIFATAAILSERGFESMPMSEDYYLDLAARFDIDTGLLAKMKPVNILYDEDAKGCYFQLYSRPYGAGFFFEIVERRDGYDGYGAPNAPYRLAAQKRLSRSKGKPGR